ncbi:hypothetical protein [Mycolicibacterium sp.]|uniref:hypothetical protein n=1 Tax=Mycolicibacterium sp. TaxID=2320850 RepID=UPI0028B0605B|nr:hypothetical protein [Mycolicibacterium sp.]
MLLISAYFHISLFVGLVCFTVAKTLDAQTSDSPNSPITGNSIIAMGVTAIFWPILLIGLAQLLLVVAVRNLFRKNTDGIYRVRRLSAQSAESDFR